MNEETKEIFYRERRRGEDTVRITWPVMYYFIHSVERADTKQFRRGEAIELSRYGLAFTARVFDAQILASVEHSSEIFVNIRIPYGDERSFPAIGRVTRVSARPETGNFLIGIEYTEADNKERDAFFDAARIEGEVVPAEASQGS